MSFLAPLFLLGAAAVVLPVIFHLIRRTTRQRTIFSSLLFLPPSPPRVTQRSRLEDLLLLLLRCLIIGMLALGFARPFLKNSAAIDPSEQPPARVVLLVDTSASMQRAGLWEAAIARATARAREAAPTDEFAVWTFDAQTRPVLSFAEWNATPVGNRAALASSRLSSLKPGWGSTRLDDALSSAAEAVVETVDQTPLGPRRIVLITDLQEGSRTDGLQAFEWPKGVEVAVDTLKARNPSNAGLQLIADSQAITATTQMVVRVRVSNSADSTVDRFEVGWARPDGAGFLQDAEAAQVSPGHTRTVALPVPDGVDVDRILLRGDDEAFDNLVYLVPPKSTPLRALYFGGESVEDQRQPLFFLQRAFPQTGRLAIEVVARRPSEVIDDELIKNSALFFVTDAVPRPVAERLHQEIASGKTLLFAPKTPEAFESLGPLLDAADMTASEIKPASYAMLGAINFQHPLLSPFADPRYSDFTKIHFWKYRRFDDAALAQSRMIARFDSGDPAWVEVSVGRGSVLIMASGWHPDDSQLALSTKFVPLLLSLAELGGGGGMEEEGSYVVGDVLPLPSGGARVRLPDGSWTGLSDASTNFVSAIPGIHAIQAGDETRKFAVNLEGAESRTGLLALETLEGLGMPVRSTATAVEQRPERKLQLAAVEAEGRQKLWRWLIVAALAILIIESALAGRQARRFAAGKESAA